MEKQEYENVFKAEDDHWWYAGMRDIFFSLSSEYLEKGMKILDAGCGTGKNAEVLAKYGNVIAFDISDDALQFSRKRGIKNLIKASVNFLPFKNNSFDFVTSFDVLYHNLANDTLAVKEMSRVCKKDGFVFVRVPALISLMRSHDKVVHTRKRFYLRELENILEKSNLEIKKITYANFFLLPAVFLQKTAHGSDIKKTGALLNSILRLILKSESLLLKHINFPAGVSLIALAQKTY